MARSRTVIGLALATTGLLAACGGTTNVASQSPISTQPPVSTPKSAGASSTPSESPVAPPESPISAENNPPGDIPDSIAFVPYHSTAGSLTISTPEGWARTTTGDSVTFTDKLNTVIASWQPASKAPTVASAQGTEVPTIASAARAFQIGTVTATSLPAGPAVLITYQANSEPNAVTGKQYRQDVQRYELFHRGREVVVTLLSPVGADNVDPWRIVTESLKWS